MDRPPLDIAQRLKQLRDRLERLNPDEITNCAARMALEKEIFDLEHSQKDSNEWPDVIDDR